MATSLTYRAKFDTSNSGAVYTSTTSPSIGTADSNRRVFVVHCGGGLRSVSSITIGGVSATLHAAVSTGNGCVTIASAIVPTGTTATIVITKSSTDFFSEYGTVYTIDDTEIDISSVDFDAQAISSAASIALNYDGTTGGVSLAGVAFQNGNISKCPITINNSFVRDYEDDFDGSLMTASLDGETSGSRTTTISWTGSFSGAAALLMIPLAGGSPDVEESLTGTAITSGQGNVTSNITYALTGTEMTASQGTMTNNVSHALSGQAITSSQGSYSHALSKALTGTAITSAQGTVKSNVNYSVTGQEISSAQGDVSPSVEYTLTGEAITASQGNVTDASAGDVTVALTGQEITSSLGDYGHAINYSLSGTEITSNQGSVTFTVNHALNGEQIEVSLGDLTATGGDTPEPPDPIPQFGGGLSSSRSKRYYIERDGKRIFFTDESEVYDLLHQEEKRVVKKAKKAIKRVTKSQLAELVTFKDLDIPKPQIVMRFNDVAINKNIDKMNARINDNYMKALMKHTEEMEEEDLFLELLFH